MPIIKLQTEIKAPVETVFDLARSIDLHKVSTAHTGETAIAGKTSGLIGLGESVTWRAKHLGFYQTLTSKVTAFEFPNKFTDEMVAGIFKSFKHEHVFKEKGGVTVMTDIFEYTSPLGIIGKMADLIFLKQYMTSFLSKRNSVLKNFVESIIESPMSKSQENSKRMK